MALTAGNRYPVPAARARVEETIHRSRFIATAGRASTVAEAQAFIEEVRSEFADATHNCWAYLIGPPGSSAHIGFSDDGEPSGTAGRPMLAVVQGSGLGDLVVVVTRYFGGIKLGAGGLVRAYAGSVKAVLAVLPRTEKIERVTVRVELPYACFAALQRLLSEYEAQVVDQRFAAEVALELHLPVDSVAAFRERVADLSRGQAVCTMEPTVG
jgi:uncharacterized YigZ family protein